MKNLFNSIKLMRPKSNAFDLTHDVKLTANMGNLTPICALDCVPGDKFKIDAESIIRFAPLIAPVMHRMDVSMHYFFVPNRLLWNNWENFITNQDGTYVHPYVQLATEDTGSGTLANYLGIPNNTEGTPLAVRDFNALPFAAYQKIWNDFYRDQNLIADINPPQTYLLGDGINASSELFELRKRAWEHDYFTASLPFAQKGNAVDIPLGGVQGDASVYYDSEIGGTQTYLEGTEYGLTVKSREPEGSIGSNDMFANTDGLSIEPTTINDLRRAFRLQEWLEKNARGGTRYIENILTHFGVKSSDARLQRPEYITGMKTPVVISEVLNTTGENGGLPQGNMAGHGISVTGGNAGYYRCEEHGWIIGVMSIMPKTAYQQGTPKMFLRRDNLDYFWPSFANIGEQEVKNREVFEFGPDQDDTFGYVPRYAEYKFCNSRVAGDFTTNLEYWHLGRKFQSLPTLSQEFIECAPEDTTRIFAVEDPDTQHLYCHVLNKITAIRPMPKYGTPMF
jgi:Capsid protein (F protein)